MQVRIMTLLRVKKFEVWSDASQHIKTLILKMLPPVYNEISTHQKKQISNS